MHTDPYAIESHADANWSRHVKTLVERTFLVSGWKKTNTCLTNFGECVTNAIKVRHGFIKCRCRQWCLLAGWPNGKYAFYSLEITRRYSNCIQTYRTKRNSRLPNSEPMKRLCHGISKRITWHKLAKMSQQSMPNQSKFKNIRSCFGFILRSTWNRTVTVASLIGTLVLIITSRRTLLYLHLDEEG